MTLTFDLSPEVEERLRQRSILTGMPIRDLVMEMIENMTRGQEDISVETSGPTLLEEMTALGAVGAVRGRLRADGRPWSEIEAPIDFE